MTTFPTGSSRIEQENPGWDSYAQQAWDRMAAEEGHPDDPPREQAIFRRLRAEEATRPKEKSA